MRQPKGEEAVQIRRPNLLSSYPASRLFSASESSELGQKSDPCLQIGFIGQGGDGLRWSSAVWLSLLPLLPMLLSVFPAAWLVGRPRPNWGVGQQADGGRCSKKLCWVVVMGNPTYWSHSNKSQIFHRFYWLYIDWLQNPPIKILRLMHWFDWKRPSRSRTGCDRVCYQCT